MDQAQLLPDDVLAGVFRHLAPRGLAMSRCVCKAWRRIVDDRQLLHADLLPLRLGGIFLNLHDLLYTQFLSRPTTSTTISGRLDYTVACRPSHLYYLNVIDHCNGLLMLNHCVVNPATQQWAPLCLLPSPPLPQPPPPGMDFHTNAYLVFDPTLSFDFEVLILPDFPYELNRNEECEESEWPPSTLILPVFSSRSGSWEERAFCREGEAAGMVPGMDGPRPTFPNHRNAYWRGALYIYCSYYFVMRISLSDKKYQAIRLPTEDRECFCLGKSNQGIYCASLFQEAQLRVWFLNDQCSNCPVQWVMKHDIDIFPILPNLNCSKLSDGPWIYQPFDPREHESFYYDSVVEGNNEETVKEKFVRGSDNNFNNKEALGEKKFEWDSDNDDVLEPGNRSKDSFIHFLGFHPFKEVIFLTDKFDRVLAYHWSSSKIQDLGNIFPKFYTDPDRDLEFHDKYAVEAFLYTPCWLGHLPEKLNSETRLED